MVRIALILIPSVILAFVRGNSNTTSTYSNKQQNDSTIVYYSYYSGEIENPIILIPGQDTAVLRKPDILIIGEILDSKELSQTIIDTLDETRFNETNSQTYTYTVKVNSVEFGLCSKKYLEIAVTSSSSHEFRFSHISACGDSVFIGTFYLDPCSGHVINQQIPVGKECIFHFKKGDLHAVDYVSSYRSDDLKKYMLKSGLEAEQ